MMVAAAESRHPRHWLAMGFFAFCLLIPIAWGAAPHSPWDVDHLAPGPALRALAQHFAPGWFSSYGPVPYLMIGAVYLPLLALFKLTGEWGTPSPVYPWGFAHAEFAMVALTVAARLISVVFALLIAQLAARRERSQTPPVPGWLVVLLLVGSPCFSYYARTSNVDMHYLFWLWVAFHLIETPMASARRLAAGAACAALAVCSKEQAAPFAVVACLVAATRAARAEPQRAMLAVARTLGAAALAYVVAWQLPFNVAGWASHHRFLFEEARYPRTYPLSPAGIAALAGHVVTLLPVTFGALLLLALGAALVLRTSWRGLAPRAIGCALYFVAFVLPIGYAYPRFLLPLLLLLLPLGARGLRDLYALAAGRPWARRAIAAAAVVLALTGAPALSLTMLQDPRLAVERWLRTDVPAGATIELAGSPGYQARLPLDRPVFRTQADSLRVAPRGPRGDVVLLSSLDLYTFLVDPVARACWMDSLHAEGAVGRYREIDFLRPPAARFNRGLPVAPTVIIWVKPGVTAR